jgi:hypothetical protein
MAPNPPLYAPVLYEKELKRNMVENLMKIC